MKYIKDEYSNFKNIIAQKKELTLKNNSFEIIEGNVPILLSAPHNVEQVRQKLKKALDLGTGHLLLKTVNKSNAYGIIKTNCKGIIGSLDDDANYEEKHEYKNKIVNIIIDKNVKALIDLHSLSKDRAEQINLGINYGSNIQNNYSLFEDIRNVFLKNGYLTSIDYPFYAGKNTVCETIASKTNIFSLQIEINSKLIHIKDKRNEFENVARTIGEIIKLINKKL